MLSISFFSVFFGQSLWRSTFYNFALDEFQLSPIEVGYLFSIASVPGIFTFSLGYIAHKTPLFVLVGGSAILFGMGLLSLGSASGHTNLTIGVIALSIGFTWFLPLANTICIRESSTETVGSALGRLKGLGPLASIIATTTVVLYAETKQTDYLLITTGIVVSIIGLITAFRLRDLPYGKNYSDAHFLVRLWPYYLLNFLTGCRSSLFKAFILTQFVTHYHFTTSQMSLLVLAGSLSVLISYRMLGYLARKYDPIDILTLLFLLVAGVFLAFFYVSLTGAVCLFVIDSLLFGSNLLTDAYLKQADQEHYLISDLATGTTFFHLAGFLLPLVSGIIWNSYGGFHGVLVLGSILAILGAITSRFLIYTIRQRETDFQLPL